MPFYGVDTFTLSFIVPKSVQHLRCAGKSLLHQEARSTKRTTGSVPPAFDSYRTIDLLLEDLGYGDDVEEGRYFEDMDFVNVEHLSSVSAEEKGHDDVSKLDNGDDAFSEFASLLSNLNFTPAAPAEVASSSQGVILDLNDAEDDFPDLASLLANLNLTIAPPETADTSPSVLTLESLSKIANSSNIAYFYLQNELKISAEDMWKITNEAGSILGMTAKTLRHKVELMRRTMDLSDDDIRTMMKRHPSILHLSADKNLAPTILFLQRALDLSREDLRALTVPFPSILCYSLVTLKAKISLFTKILGFSIDECRSLFVSQPKLLTASVTTGLLPRVQFMLREMQMPLADFRTLIKKNPLILLYSLEHNLRPKLIYFFIMTLHMEPRTVSKLLLKYPPIVDYNLNNHILPISRYLVVELEFAPIEVRQILVKFPRLITWSLFKIKHVVGYLRYELGMDAAQVKRLLYQAPQVIGLSEANLKNKVHYLRETFAFKEEELRKVVAGMPTLILCSTATNLHPKIEFLRGVLGDRELRGAILLQPSLLGYSLDKRIRPRMQAILDIGAHPRAITVGISMKDDAFRLWLNGRRARLLQDPGYDRVNKHNGEIDQLPKETPKTNPVDRSGRIVHWTRSDE